MPPPKLSERKWWSKSPVVIELDDGIHLIPMSDDEGNDAGAIATNLDDLPIIPPLYEMVEKHHRLLEYTQITL